MSKHYMAARDSRKPLLRRLGIRKGYRIFISNPPEGYYDTLGRLPQSVSVTGTLKGLLDSIHFFTRNREELENKFPILKRELSRNGMLWISWPKGASKVETDLDENVVREIGLRNGLVDVKVIVVDEIWSALKFVYRIKDRKHAIIS